MFSKLLNSKNISSSYETEYEEVKTNDEELALQEERDMYKKLYEESLLVSCLSKLNPLK